MRNNLLIYLLKDENQNLFELKSYELKKKIKKKEIYVCNMTYKKGKLMFKQEPSDTEDYLLIQSNIPYYLRVYNFLQTDNKDPLLVCIDTPSIIVNSANIYNYPIMLNKKKAKEIMKWKDEPGHGHHHELNKDELMELPDALKHPKEILVNIFSKKEIIIITQLVKEEKPIIVAIHCGVERRIKLNTYKINKISSVYPKKYSKKTIEEKYNVVYF